MKMEAIRDIYTILYLRWSICEIEELNLRRRRRRSRNWIGNADLSDG